jgi:hypothetical protein
MVVWRWQVMVPRVVGDVAISEKAACFQVSRDMMRWLWFWAVLVDVWCLTLVLFCVWMVVFDCLRYG